MTKYLTKWEEMENKTIKRLYHDFGALLISFEDGDRAIIEASLEYEDAELSLSSKPPSLIQKLFAGWITQAECDKTIEEGRK